MPLPGALLVNLFTGLATLFATEFARKVAIGLAAVTAFTAITAALFVAMRSIVVPLAGQLFSTAYGSLIGMAFPPIAGTCMTALASTWVAVTLYTWQKKAISLLTAG